MGGRAAPLQPETRRQRRDRTLGDRRLLQRRARRLGPVHPVQRQPAGDHPRSGGAARACSSGWSSRRGRSWARRGRSTRRTWGRSPRSARSWSRPGCSPAGCTPCVVGLPPVATLIALTERVPLVPSFVALTLGNSPAPGDAGPGRAGRDRGRRRRAGRPSARVPAVVRGRAVEVRDVARGRAPLAGDRPASCC